MKTIVAIALVMISMDAAACWGFREPKIDFDKMATREQVLAHKKKLQSRVDAAYLQRMDCYADSLDATQDEAQQNREYRELEQFKEQVKLTLAKLEKAAEERIAAIAVQGAGQ